MGNSNYVNRNVSFTPDMLQQLEKISDFEERSVSATIRKAVKLYLSRKREEYAELEQTDLPL